MNKRLLWGLALALGLVLAPSAPVKATTYATLADQAATYRVKAIKTADGAQVATLVNRQGKVTATLPLAQLKLTHAAQGAWQAASGYARVQAKATAWRAFDWRHGKHLGVGTALKLTGVYHHANGSTYYSVSDLTGHWLGYVNGVSLTRLSSLWGAKQADHRIVTVTRNWAAYRDFSWHQTASLYHRTYRVTGRYRHLNGSTYVSLADGQGKFAGLINAQAVTTAKDDRGVAWASGGYVLPKAKTVAYASVAGTRVRTGYAALKVRPAKVQVRYRALDGTLWDSLYDRRRVWLGYARASAVTAVGAQGQFEAATGYVTTTKKGRRLWSSFAFKTGVSTTSAYQQTYRVRGRYHHFNGNTYVSVTTGSGRWRGYVNVDNVTSRSSGLGAWLSYRHPVTITARYPIWGENLAKARGTAVRGRKYTVTGRYHHVNGSWYLSLYTGKHWVGYINAKAVRVGDLGHDYRQPSQRAAYPNAKARGFNVEVDLSSQRVYLKVGSKRVYTMYCSSGTQNSTPRGHFKIQAERGYSFYNGQEKMGAHYWTSFYQHGVYLFHSVPTDARGHYIKSQTTQLGVKPGSHGCIRLSVPDAKWFNQHVRTGTKVWIHQ